MSMTIERPLEVEERVRSLTELLAAWDEGDRTDDPAELEARREEWDALKKAMNESHSSDRPVFP